MGWGIVGVEVVEGSPLPGAGKNAVHDTLQTIQLLQERWWREIDLLLHLKPDPATRGVVVDHRNSEWVKIRHR